MITLDVTHDGLLDEHALPESTYCAIGEAVSARFPDIGGIIGISYVDDAEIRRLNRVYRKKDAVTDVLSFASDFAQHTGMLGDVVLSYPQAARQAEGGDIELELVDLIVHGILHVLGYDHEKPADAAVMFPLQDSLIATIL